MQRASRENDASFLRMLHNQCLLYTLPVLASGNDNANDNDNNAHVGKNTCRVFCALK